MYIVILFIHLTALKAVAPEGPGCMKISIKEVYSATNNLNEKNIIGEGTAGENPSERDMELGLPSHNKEKHLPFCCPLSAIFFDTFSNILSRYLKQQHQGMYLCCLEWVFEKY